MCAIAFWNKVLLGWKLGTNHQFRNLLLALVCLCALVRQSLIKSSNTKLFRQTSCTKAISSCLKSLMQSTLTKDWFNQCSIHLPTMRMTCRKLRMILHSWPRNSLKSTQSLTPAIQSSKDLTVQKCWRRLLLTKSPSARKSAKGSSSCSDYAC